ncbi:MAG: HlyD family efflux transporter periplasmic adaptor subunit [Planctomycetota bacterium]
MFVARAAWLIKRAAVVFAVCAGIFYALFSWGVVAYGPVLVHDAVVEGHTVDLGVRYDCVLQEVFAETGRSYVKGSILATADTSVHDARLNRACAAAEAAAARIEAETLAIGHEQKRLDALAAELSDAYELSLHRRSRTAVHLRWTQRELERQQHAASEGAASIREVDEAAHAHELAVVGRNEAEAGVAQARSARATAEAELAALAARRAGLAILRAEHRASLELVEQIRSDIEAATIRAPFDCRVVQRHAGPGTSLRVGGPVLTVVDPARTWISAIVRSGAASHISAGTPVEILIDDPERPVAGFVDFMEPGPWRGSGLARESLMQDSPEPDDRPVWFRIGLFEPDERLVPGTPVTLRIERVRDRGAWTWLRRLESIKRTAAGQ